MSQIAKASITNNDLRKISKSLSELSKDISEIKSLLSRITGQKIQPKNSYPWDLPNVTTTLDK